MKKRMISGIKPTGTLTLGNYIGAMKNFVELQNDNEMLVFVADLHALTIDIKPEDLLENRKNIVASYLAVGLDPAKTKIFYQSEIAAHTQLNWILENQTTVGELSRMTQYKDSQVKESNGTTKIKTGLLTYPALMAADILLYKADSVPVGSDQKQHLELTRNIAERFNNSYGETFKVPEVITMEVGARIMSLTDPEKKMSKSSTSEMSYISLMDDSEVARKKIMKAVTDSEGKIYLSDEKAGIKNLLIIYSSLENIKLEEAEAKFKDTGYGEFKTAVADTVVKFLEDFKVKYDSSINKVNEVTNQGKEAAIIIADETIKEVYKKIGL